MAYINPGCQHPASVMPALSASAVFIFPVLLPFCRNGFFVSDAWQYILKDASADVWDVFALDFSTGDFHRFLYPFLLNCISACLQDAGCDACLVLSVNFWFFIGRKIRTAALSQLITRALKYWRRTSFCFIWCLLFFLPDSCVLIAYKWLYGYRPLWTGDAWMF